MQLIEECEGTLLHCFMFASFCFVLRDKMTFWPHKEAFVSP